MKTLTNDELRSEVIRLGPWHLEVQITPDISTKVYLEAPPDSYPAEFGQRAFISPRPDLTGLLRRIYPRGLEGRSVMDCGCNCGGWLFWAKEAGAGDCFGFDVRQHCIDQAKFLAANRVWPSCGMSFEVVDLYELPRRGLKPFDLTLFSSLFYHLPDPITGLKAAADLTKEVIIVSTATRNGLPDGLLAVECESTKQVMSGVYGLNWLPTGPKVMEQILLWMGFQDIRCDFWREKDPNQPSDMGRLRMIASRKKDGLSLYDKGPGHDAP